MTKAKAERIKTNLGVARMLMDEADGKHGLPVHMDIGEMEFSLLHCVCCDKYHLIKWDETGDVVQVLNLVTAQDVAAAIDNVLEKAFVITPIPQVIH